MLPRCFLVLVVLVGCTSTNRRAVRLPLDGHGRQECSWKCEAADDTYECLRRCPGATVSSGRCDPEVSIREVACVERDFTTERTPHGAGGVLVVGALGLAALLFYAVTHLPDWPAQR